MTTQEDRIRALAIFTNEDEANIDESRYYSLEFSVSNEGDWVVLTDSEADERARDEVEKSLWAFNPIFLGAYIDCGLPADVMKRIQETMCEDANEAVKCLVGDNFDRLVKDAIGADGRGHFLSHYDGEEVELTGGLYAYRTN